MAAAAAGALPSLTANFAAFHLGDAPAAAARPSRLDLICEDNRFPRPIGTLIEKYASTGIMTIERCAQAVLYAIPAGKPDPAALCTAREAQVDGRSYIPQVAANGILEYSSFNLIRFRIGAHHCPELTVARAAEESCEQFFKTLGAHVTNTAIAREVMRGFFSNISGRVTCTITHATAKTVAGARAKMGLERSQFLQEYIAQPATTQETFSDYVQRVDRERRIGIVQSFFGRHGCMTVADAFKQANLPPPCQDWVGLNADFKKAHAVSVVLATRIYGLQPAAWHGGASKASIDDLIAELATKGPLCAQGLFGEIFYSEPEFQLQERLAGAPVYGWKPGTRNNRDASVPLPILIVGATKAAGRESVYYVNPILPSKPQAGVARAAYKISYASLKQYARPFAPGNYAYSGPRFIPPAQGEQKKIR